MKRTQERFLGNRPLMKLLVLAAGLLPAGLHAQTDRWNLRDDGGIEWIVKNDTPHRDHIEMSGEQMSVVLRYGVEADGSFSLERSMVWPMLRTIPNNTHASLMRRFAADIPSLLQINGRTLQGERVGRIVLDGVMRVYSTFENRIELERTIFPSPTLPVLCEKYLLRNGGDKPVTVNVPETRLVYTTDPATGVDGGYTMVLKTSGSGLRTLAPGEEILFGVTVQAYSAVQHEVNPSLDEQYASRIAFRDTMWNNLVFECPDEVLNRAFAFAKIRACESIYRTKAGLLHSPGGESYYAAIWANDQAEYIGPFFPYVGYSQGNESAMNAYGLFAQYVNDAFDPIPSSIIAEGTDFWNGAGDRGDAAMIAYGAARYALVRADVTEARKLWPLIKWCLEYCHRKLNDKGVVASDSDELEGRFPAGDANLCTSSLYYDALISAAYLARELGEPQSTSTIYRKQAATLKKNINAYFGATVEGFETYRYYDGNEILRAWICIPLTTGILERKKGTVDALFSPRLWTGNGLLTQAGSTTFWDRSTLYALRGVYAAGEREAATEYLKRYSRTRLLGEHVPYPIEAWPEGNQRHLSAESALYCRIITEGLMGIRPTGFGTFELTPQLPDDWDVMSLRNIHGFGTEPFDLMVTRIDKDQIRISVISGEKRHSVTSQIGKTISIKR